MFPTSSLPAVNLGKEQWADLTSNNSIYFTEEKELNTLLDS